MSDIVERLRHHARVGDGWTRPDAAEAADEIERLRAERAEAVAALALYRMENGCTRGQRTTQWCDAAEKALAERDRLQAGLMRVIQYENGCDQTGRSCDASKKCGCGLEAETWCDGDGT